MRASTLAILVLCAMMLTGARAMSDPSCASNCNCPTQHACVSGTAPSTCTWCGNKCINAEKEMCCVGEVTSCTGCCGEFAPGLRSCIDECVQGPCNSGGTCGNCC